MKRLQAFVRHAFIGGAMVLLPLAILGIFFMWLFDIVTGLIAPVTGLLTKWMTLPPLLVDVLAILLILLACFLVGTLTATGVGRLFHAKFELQLRRFAPGYKMIKDIINQLFGDKSNSPFRSGTVARVRVLGEQVPVTVTAIVTSFHENGDLTVFVPTGPNPTTGFIFHVPPHLVELRPDIKVESAFRTIIACGAGSGELFQPQAQNLDLEPTRKEAS